MVMSQRCQKRKWRPLGDSAPVLQSSKFEFVINLQTARALGIEMPNSIQLLAAEVIGSVTAVDLSAATNERSHDDVATFR
jgi:hypothetical protein